MSDKGDALDHTSEPARRASSQEEYSDDEAAPEDVYNYMPDVVAPIAAETGEIEVCLTQCRHVNLVLLRAIKNSCSVREKHLIISFQITLVYFSVDLSALPSGYREYALYRGCVASSHTRPRGCSHSA